MAAAHDSDVRTSILPRRLLPLLDEKFVRSCALIERYTVALAAQAARSSGIAHAIAGPATLTSVLQAAGLRDVVAQVPVRWLLETLVHAGVVARMQGADAPRYQWLDVAIDDPGEIQAQQAALDDRCLPSYRIAALAAERYPAVLRGELTGEQALFGADTFDAWCAYFSNDNPLYAIANSIGALLVEEQLAQRPGAILEIGGGLGSGAQAVWRRLQAGGCTGAVEAYRFTEVSGIFLRRAQKQLRPMFPEAPFSFAKLDIDQPFADAGVAPASCRLVYGVNVLHVAHDLAATLEQIRTALVPDGRLIIAECIRPFADRPVYVEFVFNLLASFRSPLLVPGWRPNGGFLTPEQWRAALEANGFCDIRFLPDIAGIREDIPAFVVAGVAARPV